MKIEPRIKFHHTIYNIYVIKEEKEALSCKSVLFDN